MHRPTILFACLTALALPERSVAQPLGTFRWQLQPYCNVVSLTVTQVGGQYRLEGTDDQCGAGRDLAAVQGLAFPNPDGSIGFGMTIVTAPGGRPVHVDAEIAIATLGGTWRDSAGGTGTFAFTPGGANGGSPRPQPGGGIPPSVFLLSSGTAPTGDGTRLLWHNGKWAFRAGYALHGAWDEAKIGLASVGFGQNTEASGYAATAFGLGTAARHDASTAMGSATVADGPTSTAMGDSTVARGWASTAMGVGSAALGHYSTAMGFNTTARGDGSLAAGSGSEATGRGAIAIGLAAANGNSSLALGRGFTTVDATGSFVFGDGSTTNRQVAFAPNTFVVRAAGGARFFSHSTADMGPVLLAGGTDWIAVSDVNVKHRFRDLDGEDVLGRIARMPVTEWSYKAQDPAIRHIGPTAQDFHAAFGLGQDPLRISPLDSGGVALAAARALEARTRELREENASLRAAVAELRAALDLLATGRAR